MPVPFEALLPLGVIAGMFAAAGAGIGALQRNFTLGKACHTQRMNLDQWDRAMMARNERLTGHTYGQSDAVVAPEEFSRSTPVLIRKLSSF
ncbi:hypothetical protein BCR44DRAFT_70318 [Catenaria anguillulae PL171]|uniref:NADH dehydrogenase [ubiquinone] 1 alpha subcomplex subunit 1 n=1 Tax=Catenaria anguillulae PL171 TaxID=765915 RepID=A0A1Y2HAU4_9FUNG|nr:hypothetical protein BCR44DRAFT_70318 [Catenaria anguillulae PL171]